LRGEGMKTIEALVKRGLLLKHKAGKYVSPNTGRKKEIIEIMENRYPDYYF
jgi:hypothetical protein